MCRSKQFIPLRNPEDGTKTVDWQRIRLQELAVDESAEDASRIPKSVECELSGSLVGSCVPGDVVRICGVVNAGSTDESSGKPSGNSLYTLFIQANSLINEKKVPEEDSEAVFGRFLTPLSVSQSDLFSRIVNSIAPGIYGHQLVKAGLALAVFGGNRRFASDKSRIPVRGDPHVLIVGDPGLGKSQMLQAIASVVPRGVYVCGNTATSAGLTVTLSKESGSGDFALEAGALVLSDLGCCCIDEFDKMSEHAALLEAMEQQSISIAKAGLVCSLPARASILAAANPVDGHYKYVSLSGWNDSDPC